MTGILKYLAQRRFNVVDVIAIVGASEGIEREAYALGVVWFCVFIAISFALEAWLKRRAKARQS